MTTKEIESELLLNRDNVPSQELIHICSKRRQSESMNELNKCTKQTKVVQSAARNFDITKGTRKCTVIKLNEQNLIQVSNKVNRAKNNLKTLFHIRHCMDHYNA